MSRVPHLCASPQPIVMRFLSFWASGQPRAQMRRALGFFACIVCVVATVPTWAQSVTMAKPEEVGLSAERLQRIGQVFNREIEQGKLPGAVVIVARKGRVAYFESFGFRDKAAGAPMAKDAVFEIYSMTKPLVSVAAMMLVEEGRLQLADPVTKFLPEFAGLQVSVPRLDATSGKLTYSLVSPDRPMTIQDLLRHTSGLVYGDFTSHAQVKEAYIKEVLLKPGTILTMSGT
jgi:CubicO group peptidase (beta-lactamase class C family)